MLEIDARWEPPGETDLMPPTSIAASLERGKPGMGPVDAKESQALCEAVAAAEAAALPPLSNELVASAADEDDKEEEVEEEEEKDDDTPLSFIADALAAISPMGEICSPLKKDCRIAMCILESQATDASIVWVVTM